MDNDYSPMSSRSSNDPLHILLVGADTVDVMMIMSALTQLAPHNQIAVASAPAELERQLHAAATFDLVLLDLDGGLGLAALKRLRQLQLPMAAVVLAAPDDQREGIAALKLGVDHYVVKRGHYLRELGATLERVLGARAPQRWHSARALQVLHVERPGAARDALCSDLARIAAHIHLDSVADLREAQTAGANGEPLQSSYDVLLLDGDSFANTIGGGEPQAIAAQVRAAFGADMPVVLMAQRCSAELAAKALQAGIADYFVRGMENSYRLAMMLETAQRRGELARQESALRRSVARMQHLLAAAPTLLYALEWQGGALLPTWVSDNIGKICGYDAAQALQCEWWEDTVHPLDRERVRSARALLPGRGELDIEYRVLHRSGGVLWVKDHLRVLPDPAGARIEVLGAWSDVTQYKEDEARIEKLTHYDVLTGLPNRLLFETQLDAALDAARDSGSGMAVMLIDIDRFRDINESLGHGAGDELLRAAAARLAELLATRGMLGRFGGDEFVLLVQRVDGAAWALELAQEIIDVLAQPVSLGASDDMKDIDIKIGGSIGISLFPEHGASGCELIQHADAALNCAKGDGRAAVQLYAAELTQRARERLQTIIRLRSAVENESLQVVYQPKVDIRSNRIVGAEALARWWDPDSGFISPNRFIPIAEESGLVHALSESILLQACRDARAWQLAALPPIVMSVNLSPRQLEDPKIPLTIAAILDQVGLEPGYLEFELTEGALMTESEDAENLLRQIKSHGVRLSLDDFGVGYSSLAYLRRFPLDTIKIDKRFVENIPNDKDDIAILSAIVQLAHALGFEVLAEGVETVEQLEFLKDLGCDLYQGYLFSAPVPFDEFTRLLVQSAANP